MHDCLKIIIHIKSLDGATYNFPYADEGETYDKYLHKSAGN